MIVRYRQFADWRKATCFLLLVLLPLAIYGMPDAPGNHNP